MEVPAPAIFCLVRIHRREQSVAGYIATVIWSLGDHGDEAFLAGRYSRAHRIRFDGGAEIDASSSPHVVPPPWSAEAAIDPEEMLVAALANCHMLTFLHKAREAGFVVTAYEDAARGRMGKMAAGGIGITDVTLAPRVTWRGDIPSPQEEEALHHAAHEDCFIANSVLTRVRIEPPHR